MKITDTLKEYLAELVLAGLEDRAPAPLPEGLPLEQLAAMTHEMHMDYLLLAPLLRLPLAPQQQQRLQAPVLGSMLQSRTQLHSIAQIQRLFEDAGIKHQFLKGSVMKGLYPRAECREMSDIDVMVYGNAFARAGALLAENGYTLRHSVKHHDIYVKPPFLVVELHWALYDQLVDENQAEYYKQFCRLRAKPGFQYAYEFSHEDFYVYMISHIARHFYESGCGIRNLVDVFVYQRSFGHSLDKHYLAGELAACGLVGFEQNLRELALFWLGGGPRQPHFDVFFSYMCSCGIYGKDENGIWSRFSRCEKQGPHAKGQHLRRWYYFPPYGYMVDDYPWLEKRRWLLPWAWAVRAVTGFVQNKGRNKLRLLRQIQGDEILAIQQLYQTMGLDFHKKGAPHA